MEAGKIPVYPGLIRKKAIVRYKAEKEAELKRKQKEYEAKIEKERRRRAEAERRRQKRWQKQQEVVKKARAGHWVRINSDGSVSGAGEAAFSPSQAKAMGYKWGTTTRKNDKTIFVPLPKEPTGAEYLGILQWKVSKGHYKRPEVQKQIKQEIELGGKKYGITAPAWAGGYMKQYSAAAREIRGAYQKAVESQKTPSGYELKEITLGKEGLRFGYVGKQPLIRPPVESILPPTKKIPGKQVIPERDEPKYKEVPKGFIRPTPYAPEFGVSIPSDKRVTPKPSPLPSPTTIPLTPAQAAPLKVISSIGEKVKEVWTWKPKTIREAETAKKEVAESFFIPTKDVDKLIGKYEEPPKEVKERYKKIEDYETESTRFRIKYGIPDKPATGIEAKAFEDLYMSGKMSKSVYDKFRTGKFEIPVEIGPEAKTAKRFLEQSDKIARQKGWLKKDRLILPTQPTGEYTSEAQKWLTTYEKAIETAKPYEKTTPGGVVMYQFPIVPTKIGKEIITGSKALETKYKVLQVKSRPVKEYETWLGRMFQKTPTGEFKTKPSGELVYKPVIKKYLESQEKVTTKGIIEEPSKGFITKPVTTALLSGGEWWREKVSPKFEDYAKLTKGVYAYQAKRGIPSVFTGQTLIPKVGTTDIQRGLVVETPAATAEVLGLGTYAGEFAARKPKEAAALALPVAIYTGKGMYQFGRERPGEFLGTMVGMKYTFKLSPIKYTKVKIPTTGKVTKISIKTKTIGGKPVDLPMAGKGWRTGGIKVPIGLGTKIVKGETTWRGLGFVTPIKRTFHPIIGLKGRQPVIGEPLKMRISSEVAPKVKRIKGGDMVKVKIPPEGFGRADISAGRMPTEVLLKPKAAVEMETGIDIMRKFAKIKPEVKRPLRDVFVQRIPRRAMPKIEDIIKKYEHVVYGSIVEEMFLKKAPRKAHDIDLGLRKADMPVVRQEIIRVLQEELGKKNVRRALKGEGIEVLQRGEWRHAVDIHPLEWQEAFRQAPAFGVKLRPWEKVDGITTVSLGEQWVKKGTTWLAPEYATKGELGLKTEWRLKDIPGWSKIGRGVEASVSKEAEAALFFKPFKIKKARILSEELSAIRTSEAAKHPEIEPFLSGIPYSPYMKPYAYLRDFPYKTVDIPLYGYVPSYGVKYRKPPQYKDTLKKPKEMGYKMPKFIKPSYYDGRYVPHKTKYPKTIHKKIKVEYPLYPKIEIPKTTYPKTPTITYQETPKYPPMIEIPRTTYPKVPYHPMFEPSIWIPKEPIKPKRVIKPKKVEKKLKPRRKPFGAYQLDVTNPILSPVELLRMMGGFK